MLNTTGTDNTANGARALLSNTASYNTAIGSNALVNNTTGTGNTAIGLNALQTNSSGSNNTAVGNSAGSSVTTADNVICIGVVLGANVNSSCFIGNIRGVQTRNADAIPVLIDSNGQLGTASSSRRFKKEIKAMDQASEAILGLSRSRFTTRAINKARRNLV